MKMRRIVTAENKSGVVMQASDLLESTSADLTTNIWGFDQIPNLPLTAKQVLGHYQKKGIFGPKGSVRVNVASYPPEKGNQAPELGPLISKLDLGTGGGMTPGKEGGGMHRTDSIDLAVVISGEIDLAYPGEDGHVKEIHLKQGDFLVQNGAFHEWRNRSGAHCVIFLVVFAADRKAA